MKDEAAAHRDLSAGVLQIPSGAIRKTVLAACGQIETKPIKGLCQHHEQLLVDHQLGHSIGGNGPFLLGEQGQRLLSSVNHGWGSASAPGASHTICCPGCHETILGVRTIIAAMFFLFIISAGRQSSNFQIVSSYQNPSFTCIQYQVAKITFHTIRILLYIRSSKASSYSWLCYVTPTRGLLGYKSEVMSDTRGMGVMSYIFSCYDDYAGDMKNRKNGVLVCMESCTTVAYALFNLQNRGRLFMGPGVKVYRGQIIGEHCRENDMTVNPAKGKQLSNVRAAGSDENVY